MSPFKVGDLVSAGGETTTKQGDTMTITVETKVNKKNQEAEYARLTGEQQALYNEAVGCGATHDDAMEAAETAGYTK